MKGGRKTYNVAVVGATGAVGSEMIRVLEQRQFPVQRIAFLASERSAGKRLRFRGRAYTVQRLTAEAFSGIDVALFSAGAARSLEFAPAAVQRGAVVVDNSSAFRMDPQVPLVVPEVNPGAIRRHRGIIANPNCSTIILVVALKPLHDAARIARCIVTTFQSVSGAGAKAMHQLVTETGSLMRRLKVHADASAARSLVQFDPHVAPSLATARILPSQIAWNVIPQIDQFADDGYTKEEWKMVRETRKIMELPDLPVLATCVRVPVLVGHAESVAAVFERPLSPDDAREMLRHQPGLRVIDVPSKGRYPMPVDCAGRDEVLVGRIRRDPTVPHGLAFWVVGDNLRKGAATNAVQIAELVCAR